MSSLRIVAASAVVAFILVLGIAAWMDRRTPVAVVVAPLPEESIRVSIAGAVATPGVLSTAPDARLADVIDAAGGLTADADVSGLNLAGRVGDGEHIVIPRLRAGPVPAGAAQAPELIDLNVASAAELEALPGIGEVLAARIVAHREAHGPFTSVDELLEVEGITARTLEQLRPLVTVTHGG